MNTTTSLRFLAPDLALLGEPERTNHLSAHVKLRVRGGVLDGRVLRFCGPSIRIGSDATCNLRIAGPEVPAVHSVIRRGPQTTTVEALCEQARLNSESFSRAELQQGSVLNVGPYALEVLHLVHEENAPADLWESMLEEMDFHRRQWECERGQLRSEIALLRKQEALGIESLETIKRREKNLEKEVHSLRELLQRTARQDSELAKSLAQIDDSQPWMRELQRLREELQSFREAMAAQVEEGRERSAALERELRARERELGELSSLRQVHQELQDRCAADEARREDAHKLTLGSASSELPSVEQLESWRSECDRLRLERSRLLDQEVHLRLELDQQEADRRQSLAHLNELREQLQDLLSRHATETAAWEQERCVWDATRVAHDNLVQSFDELQSDYDTLAAAQHQQAHLLARQCETVDLLRSHRQELAEDLAELREQLRERPRQAEGASPGLEQQCDALTAELAAAKAEHVHWLDLRGLMESQWREAQQGLVAESERLRHELESARLRQAELKERGDAALQESEELREIIQQLQRERGELERSLQEHRQQLEQAAIDHHQSVARWEEISLQWQATFLQGRETAEQLERLRREHEQALDRHQLKAENWEQQRLLAEAVGREAEQTKSRLGSLRDLYACALHRYQDATDVAASNQSLVVQLEGDLRRSREQLTRERQAHAAALEELDLHRRAAELACLEAEQASLEVDRQLERMRVLEKELAELEPAREDAIQLRERLQTIEAEGLKASEDELRQLRDSLRETQEELQELRQANIDQAAAESADPEQREIEHLRALASQLQDNVDQLHASHQQERLQWETERDALLEARASQEREIEHRADDPRADDGSTENRGEADMWRGRYENLGQEWEQEREEMLLRQQELETALKQAIEKATLMEEAVATYEASATNPEGAKRGWAPSVSASAVFSGHDEADKDRREDEDEGDFRDTPTMQSDLTRDRYLDEYSMSPVSVEDRRVLETTRQMLSQRNAFADTQDAPTVSTANLPSRHQKAIRAPTPSHPGEIRGEWRKSNQVEEPNNPEDNQPSESYTPTWSFEVEQLPEESQDPLRRTDFTREDDDLQIQAYMQRLVRGGGNEPQAAPSQQPKLPTPTPSAALTGGPASSDAFIPRRHATERVENFTAMRELANISALQALRSSASRGDFKLVRTQVGGSLLAFLVAGAAYFLGLNGSTPAYYVAAAATGVGAFWCIQAIFQMLSWLPIRSNRRQAEGSAKDETGAD